MGSYSFSFSGVDVVLNDVKKLKDSINKDVQKELNAWAIETSTQAKILAPVDEGNLRGGIAPKFENLSASVTVAANYAAYIEFGTRKFAAKYVGTLPKEWKDMAARHKGKAGGSLDEFIQNIMAWVKRKGIGGSKTKSGNISQSKSSLDNMQQVAYAIALNILQNGVKPHPFLYPAYQKTKKDLMGRLRKIFY